MTKKISNVLDKDTEFSIKLSKKHPSHAMLINGVKVEGYNFKNYKLPAGTDLGSAEVKAWFIIEKPIAVKAKA
jgi:hypothetical protein